MTKDEIISLIETTTNSVMVEHFEDFKNKTTSLNLNVNYTEYVNISLDRQFAEIIKTVLIKNGFELNNIKKSDFNGYANVLLLCKDRVEAFMNNYLDKVVKPYIETIK